MRSEAVTTFRRPVQLANTRGCSVTATSAAVRHLLSLKPSPPDAVRPAQPLALASPDAPHRVYTSRDVYYLYRSKSQNKKQPSYVDVATLSGSSMNSLKNLPMKRKMAVRSSIRFPTRYRQKTATQTPTSRHASQSRPATTLARAAFRLAIRRARSDSPSMHLARRS